MPCRHVGSRGQRRRWPRATILDDVREPRPDFVNVIDDFRSMTSVAPYLALRRSSGESAAAWWEAADRQRDRPAAVTALIAGRDRVEVSPDEASSVLEWAQALAGWPTAGPKPLFLHEPDHTGA
jgi:hypothetical protein